MGEIDTSSNWLGNGRSREGKRGALEELGHANMDCVSKEYRLTGWAKVELPEMFREEILELDN